MYALAAAGHVYHLAQDHRTLCGLFVVGELQLVTQKPRDRILCTHCERLAQPAPKPKD
jgi:hypothetical protein